MNRYKPVGWRNDNYRHSLAARGYRTSYALTSFYDTLKAGGRSGQLSQVKQFELQTKAMGSRGPVDPASLQMTVAEKAAYESAGARSKWYAPLYDAINQEPMPGETFERYYERVKYNMINILDPVNRDPGILKDYVNVSYVPFGMGNMRYDGIVDNAMQKWFDSSVDSKWTKGSYVYNKDLGKFISPSEIEKIKSEVGEKMAEVSKQQEAEFAVQYPKLTEYGAYVKESIEAAVPPRPPLSRQDMQQKYMEMKKRFSEDAKAKERQTWPQYMEQRQKFRKPEFDSRVKMAYDESTKV